jgi:hypothetical protein
MTAKVEAARQPEAPGAVISRGPGETLQPRPRSRQRDAIVIVPAAAANLALQHAAVFVIVLAAIRRLGRDSKVVPRALTWFSAPRPPGTYGSGIGAICVSKGSAHPVVRYLRARGNPIGRGARKMDRESQICLYGPWSPGAQACIPDKGSRTDQGWP